MKLAQPVGVVVGIGLMAAPAALGYAGTGAGNLQRVIGPLAASFAVIASWEATLAVRWANVVLAAMLVLSPVGADDAASAAVGVTCGLVLGAVTPFGGSGSHRFGAGWLGLLNDGKGHSNRRETS